MPSSLVVSFDPPLPLNRAFVSERFIRIINDLNIVERYFDNKLVKELFDYYDKNSYKPLIKSLLTLAKLNKPAYASVTGVFLEMIYKYDQESFKALQAASATGNIKIIPSAFYGGLYPLCANSGDEIGEQIKLVSDLITKYGLQKAQAAAMPFLIYNSEVEKGAKASGVEAVITEEVEGFTDHRFVYSNLGGEVKVISRNRKASEALANGDFDQAKPIDGVIYISAEEIAQKGPKFAEVLGNYFYNSDLDLGPLPSSNSPATGTIYVPQGQCLQNLSYYDGKPVWSKQKAQRMLMDKMCGLLTYVKWLGDQKLLQIWRILMQGDIFLSLTEDQVKRVKIITDPNEALIAYSYVLGDFEGKLASLILKKKEKMSELEARQKI